MVGTLEPLTMPLMPDAACQPQSDWLQLSESLNVNPHNHNLSLFHNPGHNPHHAVQDLHEVDAQGRFGGSMQNSDPIALNSEYAQGSGTLEHVRHEANGEIVVGIQQQCDPVPSTTRPERARETTGKRDRDKNWTEEETSVLVECKRLAFHDKASPFRKRKSNAINWEAISSELRTNPNTRASEKTGEQCRLRFDTLVKSHRVIKEWCMNTKKGYVELKEEEIGDLKLATTLNKEWYEVIDTISRKARSQKRDSPSPSVGGFVNLEGSISENFPLPVSSNITPTDIPGSHPLLPEGAPPVSTQNSPPSCNLRAPLVATGAGTSSTKQIAIPGFSSLDGHLRSTLLDLISGRRFFRYFFDGLSMEDVRLSRCCRWLSIIQNRRCSDIYNEMIMLVKMELVHTSGSHGTLSIDQSRFRVFDKFVKEVILNNPVYDTHSHLRLLGYTMFIAAREFSIPQRITVLKLDGCPRLERVDLGGLRKLRSLYIFECPVLVEVTGWESLRELGWLEIDCCGTYHAYRDLQNLPCLREFRFNRQFVSNCPLRHDLDINQSVRIRRLEIWNDDKLEESGDLSSLKWLEILSFDGCGALSTIAGFSGLHSLTHLSLRRCKALRSLPDMGHMKELVCINVSETGLEEILGIANLVRLKTLDCSLSKLKHLPDLNHLPELRNVYLLDTPLYLEDDLSSFYFGKFEVLYNCEETGRTYIDVSYISDTEYNSLSDSSDI